jgi:hypothetical protein
VAEALLRGVEQGRYLLLIGDIGSERRRVPPLFPDLADRRVGEVNLPGMGHGHVKAVAGQLGGDDPPHSADPPCHQRDPCVGGPGVTCCPRHLRQFLPASG